MGLLNAQSEEEKAAIIASMRARQKKKKDLHQLQAGSAKESKKQRKKRLARERIAAKRALQMAEADGKSVPECEVCVYMYIVVVNYVVQDFHLH